MWPGGLGLPLTQAQACVWAAPVGLEAWAGQVLPVGFRASLCYRTRGSGPSRAGKRLDRDKATQRAALALGREGWGFGAPHPLPAPAGSASLTGSWLEALGLDRLP